MGRKLGLVPGGPFEGVDWLWQWGLPWLAWPPPFLGSWQEGGWPRPHKACDSVKSAVLIPTAKRHKTGAQKAL